MSTFAKGIKDLILRGVPITQSHTGQVFWVSNASTILTGQSNGSDSNDGSFNHPFATTDRAINQCLASRGDIVGLKPGHAETLATASAITADVAGVAIVGFGTGALVPTLTFSDVAATMVISAASVTMQNIIIAPSVDSVVSPIVVSGADCWLDIEHRDASAAVEAVRTILTEATADNLHVDLTYKGFAAGNACVNAIRLVGGDNADINVNFHGVASTSVVEFLTTACTNVKVNGYTFNSGTTDGTKLVVDTVTGSTWFADIYDGAAGARFSGGSGSALASDDITAINTNLGTSNATTTDSINGKLGTDTELADRSLFDQLVGDGPAVFPAAAAAANDVSLAEVMRYMSELQIPRTVLKSTGDLTASGLSVALFTVTGDVMCQVFGTVDVAVTCTSTTSTASVGVLGNTAALCIIDTIDGTAFDIGDSWSLTTAADANAADLDAGWVVIGNGVNIVMTVNVDDITAGDIDFYCRYIPLTSGSTVVAA